MVVPGFARYHEMEFPREEGMTTDTRAGPNILVADDTVENLRLLSGILGECGYEVRPVTNGRQALQAAEREPPDLILLDINMPELDGFEVCARLKQQPELKDVPVIFLTALTDVADKVRAFGVGGIDYITKPFQVEEVTARVKTHLSLRRAGRDLAQSYERLRALEKLRDDLVHMVVHDMRSPLMVLMGHLELMQADVARLGAQSSEDLHSALRGARALNRMTNDLLDVSRLEEGKFPLSKARHDLVELLERIAGSVGVLDRARSIVVTASGAVAAECDGDVLGRVLLNLLSNAIKHTPAGCRIEASISVSDDRVRVEVADEGPGVPAEARAAIFQKFGAPKARVEQKYHSAGLGLAFCKLAVEAHGGSIGITPRNPRGSVFWFEIPRP
jgi:two-component system, sensor histidine kinase and response regulator